MRRITAIDTLTPKHLPEDLKFFLPGASKTVRF